MTSAASELSRKFHTIHDVEVKKNRGWPRVAS